MNEVVRFPRQRKKPPRVRRQQWRSLNASWFPLAAVVGVALAGYLITEQFPTLIGGNGAFSLCVRAKQQNCVIDGDTIRYERLTIRLEDIDTPETRGPKCAFEAALGRQATKRLLVLMNEGPFEVVRTGSRDEDIYGRKLRTVMRDGRSVGNTLVAEGLARPWDGARRSWCG